MQQVSLLSRRVTDILLVDINTWPEGVFADPMMAEGRAAWYSFAFWLRLASGAHLDVDPLELQSGFRSISRDNRVIGQAFLCDQLENGAGYCRELALPGEFKTLLDQAIVSRSGSIGHRWSAVGTTEDGVTGARRRMRYLLQPLSARFWEPRISRPARLASRSGYGTNRPVPHSIVDLNTNWEEHANPWFTIVDGDRSRISSTLARIGYSNAESFGTLRGYVHVNQARKKIVIERHPLWQDDHPEWLVAQREAIQRYPGHIIHSANPFRIIRRPADSI